MTCEQPEGAPVVVTVHAAEAGAAERERKAVAARRDRVFMAEGSGVEEVEGLKGLKGTAETSETAETGSALSA